MYQFNIHLSFDRKQYGVGITKNMTQKEIGQLVIELGLQIVQESSEL